MTTQPKTDTKTFTVEQANAMLPLVRAIVSDIAELSRDVFDRRESLEHLLAGRQLEEGDVYSDELAEVQKGLEDDTERLRRYVIELQELGVECKGATEGLVDFPAIRDGEIVYLCWKLGEPTVAHWHEVDSNFAGRKPLDPEILALGSDGAETMRR
ncbi:MAG: DUF2203 domain-containing protein [Pirellulales bacterium]|nr:DUF2203 domain-containing protein [Pirellulales bacterium]